jgi:hypothetical protein
MRTERIASRHNLQLYSLSLSSLCTSTVLLCLCIYTTVLLSSSSNIYYYLFFLLKNNKYLKIEYYDTSYLLSLQGDLLCTISNGSFLSIPFRVHHGTVQYSGWALNPDSVSFQNTTVASHSNWHPNAICFLLVESL